MTLQSCTKVFNKSAICGDKINGNVRFDNVMILINCSDAVF
jgi:hypothetical protein